MKILGWVARLSAAIIMGQTLFFKFSGAAESKFIFGALGVEPWGRYLSGIMELISAIMLLTPSMAWLGALLACGIMSGAILSHLFVLGIVVQDDGGTLFALACTVLVASLYTLYDQRAHLEVVVKKMARGRS